MTKTIIKKSIAVLVLTAIAFGAMLIFAGKKSGGAAVNVDARVAIRAEIDEELTVHFAETYSINSDKVKNGNGRRWVFMPPGNTYRFEGVDDITSGKPEKVVTATSVLKGEKNEIHWMYPPKTGRRTFVVNYTVKGAARPASDGYVFSWSFFDKSNPLNVDDFSVQVVTPDGGTIEDPAFSRTGPTFTSLPAGGSSIEMKSGKLSAFTVAEATFPFTAQASPSGIPPVSGTAVSAVEAIKSKWEANAKNDRLKATLMKVMPVSLAAIVIVIIWLVFQRFGREYKVENPPIYERELPTGETPAEVGWLTRFGTIDTTDLTGTIVDLARRRYMRIQEPPNRDEENVILLATPERAKSGEVLAPHEMRTLVWLFPAGTGTVDFNARKEELKANQTVWTEFWGGFQSDVDNLGNSKGLIERKASGCLVVGLGILGMLMIILSVIAGIAFSSKWWIATAFAGGVTTVASGGMSRRTRLGAETNEKWQAFKRYIHDFSTIPDHPPASVIVWEHYLAYAIPLGEGDTVVEYMKLRPPVEGQNDWYPANTAALLWMSSGVGDWQTAGTPSSSGSGGGFSGGGGGGFGGGGGASFD